METDRFNRELTLQVAEQVSQAPSHRLTAFVQPLRIRRKRQGESLLFLAFLCTLRTGQ